MRIASTVAAGLLELLAPRRCPGCDGPSPSGVFCGACAPLLEPLEHPGGAPGGAAYIYGGPLADAIVRLKYAGRSDLARPLGALLAEAALGYGGKVDRVAPVPLHPARLRARGFNQSALLATAVARALGVPLDTRGLVRTRPTREQAGLPREARRENLEGAFGVRGARADRVLLIDDVRTTGATLAAAASALTAAGCVEVHTFALAQAR